jgi:hypothetical protein
MYVCGYIHNKRLGKFCTCVDRGLIKWKINLYALCHFLCMPSLTNYGRICGKVENARETTMGETSMDNEYRIHKYFLCYKQSCNKLDHVNENRNTMGGWGTGRTQKTEALMTTIPP